MEGKWCFAYLTALYSEVVGLIDEGRRVNVIYLSFIKGFDAMSMYLHRKTDKTWVR